MDKYLEVDTLNEIPILNSELKYFACIGGNKNYQCFLENKKMSRAEFMKTYLNFLDPCHIPIYEDDDIIIRQDAQIAIPGFYIVATKEGFRKISSMESELYRKCVYYSFMVKKMLNSEYGISKTYMYYDEHYIKPSSTHFWVMPIYDDVISENSFNPTILSNDIWRYQDIFEFKKNKEKIYEINEGMRKVLKR